MLLLIALVLLVTVVLGLVYITRQPSSTKNSQSGSPATSIEAFIKTGAKDASATNGSGQVQLREDVEIEERVSILILFGTEYGCSKENAEILSKTLRATKKYRPRLENMAHHPDGLDMASEQVVLVLCATHGDGVPPATARAFIEWLPKVKGFSAYFSVLAFGDKSYTHYCKCGRDIDTVLAGVGGRRCAPLVEVDREDARAIAHWTEAVLAGLAGLPLAKTRSSLAHNEHAHGIPSIAAVLPAGSCREHPLLTRITAKRSLTASPSTPLHDKTTMHLEVDVQGLGCSPVPGDALGVLPLNNAAEVQRLLKAAGLEGADLVEKPAWASDESSSSPIRLDQALLHYYDLRQPRASLLSALSSSFAFKSQQLNLSSEMFLQCRHVADILEAVGARGHFTASTLLSHMRPLLPRLYSISSSALHNAQHISITVAEVRYEALGLAREGVSSTFLCDRLSTDSEVAVFLQANPDFRLPASISTPIIMIGPGTGLAPFRAFIQERLAQSRRPPFPQLGPQLLFFGCRNRKLDYLYSTELEQWAKEGVIELHTAFSREGPKKVYVQTHLQENASRVLELIKQGAHIYVCGDAKYMAPQVEQCLVNILAADDSCGGDSSHGQQKLQALAQQQRYQRDVWFS